ncbi:hypothetical protein Trydic_g1577 [Trypoxylus dichotomus]
MLQVGTYVTLLCASVLNVVQTKLIQTHIVFRHGEKTPDGNLMFPTDPYKNYSFYPFGPGQLTNEGKRTMYNLGKTIRRRYNDLLGDVYTPDILDAWASSYDRCQTSLQVVLASLFPPKDVLVWEKDLNWQPIAYKSLLKKEDNMFMAFISEDYKRIYYEYCTNGEGKAVTQRIQSILSYVQKYSITDVNYFRDLFFAQIVWSGEEAYGLELPEWTKKIYPQPINNLALEDYHLHMGTKEMARYLVGRLTSKILEDSENRIENKTNYKLILYSGHDMTIGHLLTFLRIMYRSHAGWGACLAIELHDENRSHFIEVHYKDDKHSKFELLQFPSGERRLYLHNLRDMVHELYDQQLVLVKHYAMIQVGISVILLCASVFNVVQTKLLQAHIVFRHGEKTPDGNLMFPTDPYKNHSFYPFGPGQLTNEGKRTMYNLGKTIRRRYNDLLSDVYTPDILDAWASSYVRCQTSLQVVLASLFPPENDLVWEKDLNWQPIAYKSLPKQEDNMFTAFLLDDYKRMYNEYCTNGEGKAVTQRIQPILSYVRKHSKTDIKYLRDLLFTQIIWSGEEAYGLELPEWTKEIYPQPINNLALEDYHLHMGTKEMARYLVGRLTSKILEDMENRIKNETNYKLALYSGHDITVGQLLTFLKIMYRNHAGWGACLAIELHDENESHFIEVHYKDDKHSKFELLRFPSGERRLYLHDLRHMVHELYEQQAEGAESHVPAILSGKQSKLLLIHLVFRHGEKVPDNFRTFPGESLRNDSFYPYGAGALTNEGKRTMYNLGKIIRKRYDEFLGELYTPDILDPWTSALERCHASLQTVLASLFPPKGILIWEEGFNWQPIAYNFLPKKNDDMFLSLFTEEYVELYNEYVLNGEGRAVIESIQPLLAYAQEHSNITMRTLLDLAFIQNDLTGREGYGLELPEWTRKIYPQPLNDLILTDYTLRMGTKEMKRKMVGKLLKKILEDSERCIANKSNYKLHLYAAHDMTIACILTFLKIMYRSHAGWGASLAFELHEQEGYYFIEVHYKNDKHSKFEVLRLPNGEKLLYLHELRDMVNELYDENAEKAKSHASAMSFNKHVTYISLIIWFRCFYRN